MLPASPGVFPTCIQPHSFRIKHDFPLASGAFPKPVHGPSLHSRSGRSQAPPPHPISNKAPLLLFLRPVFCIPPRPLHLRHLGLIERTLTVPPNKDYFPPSVLKYMFSVSLIGRAGALAKANAPEGGLFYGLLAKAVQERGLFDSRGLGGRAHLALVIQSGWVCECVSMEVPQHQLYPVKETLS